MADPNPSLLAGLGLSDTWFPPRPACARSFCARPENFVYECAFICVYSNSLNDVPRVAQRYGTIAAHTRRHASVLVVFVVFSMHMHNFAGLIKWTPPPMFSDTAITDRHSDTIIFQLRAHWVPISWSIAGLSHPFLGMGPGPLELGKIASFSLKLGKYTKFYALKNLLSD